jgi:hypothetical protein
MSEKLGVTMRYRAALVGGLAVFVMLQAALFAWTRGDGTKQASQRESARLVNLPETGAPLADVSRAPAPDPTNDLAPHRAEVETLADIPVVPKLSAAASAAQPVMFMENLEEPEAEQNPAVSYAPSDFLAASSANAQPLRPIDDRPVSVLAAIGGSGRGIGIGADGPHCLPGRPAMFQRSPVVSGVPSLLRSPRM